MPYWRLSAYYFAYFACVGALVPYLGLYFQSIGRTAIEIGILMGALQAVRVLAPLSLGWLADRAGQAMPLVRGSSALAVLVAGLFFVSESFAVLLLVMALLSLLWNGPLPLVEATTLRHLGNDSGRYSLVRIWGSIGFIVAVVGLGYLFDHLAIFWLLPVVVGLLVLVLVTTLSVPEPAAQGGGAAPSSLLSILRQRWVAWFFVGVFCMAAAHGAYYTFYSIDLVEHGYSKAAVGWLWALGVAAEILIFLVVPRILARADALVLLALSCALAVLRFLMIAWGVSSLTVLVLAQLLHAATFGLHHAAAMAWLHRIFPEGHKVKGQALFSGISFGAGGTLGGVLAGVVWEEAGATATFGVAALWAVLAVLAVLRAMAALRPRCGAGRW